MKWISPLRNRKRTAGLLPNWCRQASLYSYACAMLIGSADAWDVLQNANQVILEKASELQGPEDFMPWALTIVRLQAMAFRKKASRDRHIFNLDVLEKIAQHASVQCIDFPERLSALEECLNKLSERQRDHLILRYDEGLATGEVASGSIVPKMLWRPCSIEHGYRWHNASLANWRNEVHYEFGSEARIRVFTPHRHGRTARIGRCAALEAILVDDPEAMAVYVELMTVHALLQWRSGRKLNATRQSTAALPPVAAPLPAEEPTYEFPDPQFPASRPASPVLGFLGGVAQQSWVFLSDHAIFFSALAATILVAALVTFRARNWEGQTPQRNLRSQIFNLRFQISNLKSQFPK